MNEQTAQPQAVVTPLAGNLPLWWIGAHGVVGLLASLFFAALGEGDWGFNGAAILLAAGIIVAQGLILHRWLLASFAWQGWMGASLVGVILGAIPLGVGFAVAVASVVFDEPRAASGLHDMPLFLITDDVIVGVLAGAALGFMQMLVLVRYLPRARAIWWVPANSLALTLALLAATFFAMVLPSMVESWVVYAGLFGLITGPILVRLLRANSAV